MNKKLALVSSLATFALAACGQSGQQPASSATQPSSPAEVTTPVSAGSVQSVLASDISAATLSGQACSLNTIDGNYMTQVDVEKGGIHVFRGWLESNEQKSAGEFRIVLVGAQDFGLPAKTGVPRPDVASALKNPALGDAGFNISVNLDSLPSGKYAVRFLMQGDNKSYWCDAKRSIVLK